MQSLREFFGSGSGVGSKFSRFDQGWGRVTDLGGGVIPTWRVGFTAFYDARLLMEGTEGPLEYHILLTLSTDIYSV